MITSATLKVLAVIGVLVVLGALFTLMHGYKAEHGVRDGIIFAAVIGLAAAYVFRK